MSLRSGHGNGRGTPHVEVLPPDELPEGVQAPPLASARGERRPDGTFAPGARTAQSAGGLATRGKSKLTARLGLTTLAEGDAFAPYRRAAATFRRVQCAELARAVGGGVCGPGPSSVVASAALALAWSRYLSDQAAATGDPELAMRSARLGETSRQHLLAAHELCAKEALARPRKVVDLAARFIARGNEPAPTPRPAASVATPTTNGATHTENASTGHPGSREDTPC
jgi:hypothetical protein